MHSNFEQQPTVCDFLFSGTSGKRLEKVVVAAAEALLSVIHYHFIILLSNHTDDAVDEFYFVEPAISYPVERLVLKL